MNTLYNIDAERAVIGCLFINNNSFMDIREIVTDSAFQTDAHQIIWEAACAVYDAGKPTDIIIVSEHLTSTGNLERVGGTPYLSELRECVPTSINAKVYAETVADLYRKRQILLLSEQLKAGAESGLDVSDIAAKIMELSIRKKHISLLPVNMDGWRDEAMKPLNWLIDRWLLRGTVTVLEAAGGTGKSLLSLGLVIETITGWELWAGMKSCVCGSVVLFDLENDKLFTYKRMCAYGEHFKIDPLYMDQCVNKHLHLFTERGAWLESHGNFYKPSSIYLNMLEYCVKTKPVLIVIDHLRRISGTAEENYSSVIDTMIELCDRIARESGAAVLLLAHTNKAASNRGASAIGNESQCVWGLRQKDGESLALMRTKANHASSMTDSLCFKIVPVGDSACIELPQINVGRHDDIVSLVINYIRRNNSEISLGAVRKCTGEKAKNLFSFVKADFPSIKPNELYIAIKKATEAGRLNIIRGKNSYRHYRNDLISLPDMPQK